MKTNTNLSGLQKNGDKCITQNRLQKRWRKRPLEKCLFSNEIRPKFMFVYWFIFVKSWNFSCNVPFVDFLYFQKADKSCDSYALLSESPKIKIKKFVSREMKSTKDSECTDMLKDLTFLNICIYFEFMTTITLKIHYSEYYFFVSTNFTILLK